MSQEIFPHFQNDFEKAIAFIIDNVSLNIQETSISLEGPVYDSSHNLPVLRGKLTSASPFLQLEDFKLLADYIRLQFYVYPTLQTEKGSLGINFNEIEYFTNPQWQSQYWMAKSKEIVGDSVAILTKGSQKIAVNSGKWIFEGDWKVAPNDTIETVHSIFFPTKSFKNVREGKSGFEFINGRELQESDGRQIIRFYLNFQPDWNIIKNFIEDVYLYCDPKNIPYTIKILSQKEDFNRSDSVILYSDQKSFFYIKYFLESVYLKYHSHLREPVPIFTYKLYKGIGFAEEPDTPSAESVGQNRSKLIAEIIARLAVENVVEKKMRIIRGLEIIRQQYQNLNSFYLNPHSNFPYDLVFSPIELPIRIPKKINFFLQGAIEVGHILCKEAIWIDDKHCNWLNYQNDKNIVTYRLLDNSLADGRAGIKLFLLTLYDAYKDPIFKKTLGGLNDIDVKTNVYKRKPLKSRYFRKNRIFHFWTNENTLDEIDLDLIDKETFKALSEGTLINRWVSNQNANLARQNIKTHFLDKERPLKNGLGTDFFCPTLKHGYAGLGYFFLRVYSPQFVKPVKF
ncbi:T3SS effector HopA1 family protein [Runella zeae]|uniref:T3SS effector HopA1 family protein n=1 Tax=Runella zeae TaxID=94255 RepID=UPI00040C1C43|nr:T3SS effector HopA1 family protein [Runella zeae]